jgi:polyketide synthase Type III
MAHPKILTIGTAVPEHKFTQQEMAALLGVKDEKSLRFFEHEHVKTRHLILPKNFRENNFKEETPAELREKFLFHAVSLIEKALDEALLKISLKRNDVDFITCVTSTSFMVPGLSAYVLEKLKLKKNTQRLDIVGMGCNAGLNGLNAVANWSSAHPEKVGVLICCELCSCIYSMEESENAALVNSLFGDGVAVCLISCREKKSDIVTSTLIDYQGHVIADTLSLLRFDWNDEKHRYSFFVDKKTPEALASEIDIPLREMLDRHQLKISSINHWIVHSGGAAILDSLEKKLGLNRHSFRHTRNVLENFGNISSGSFLFSYDQLIHEKNISAGDYGVMITMGPGLTIEMALVKF